MRMRWGSWFDLRAFCKPNAYWEFDYYLHCPSCRLYLSLHADFWHTKFDLYAYSLWLMHCKSKQWKTSANEVMTSTRLPNLIFIEFEVDLAQSKFYVFRRSSSFQLWQKNGAIDVDLEENNFSHTIRAWRTIWRTDMWLSVDFQFHWNSIYHSMLHSTLYWKCHESPRNSTWKM